MEGPSLIIASEDLSPYVGKKVTKALGNAKFEEKITLKNFKSETLVKVCSWGKHFILIFKSFSLRIHFLMFGSYRVDDPKKNRDPRLELRFSPKGRVYFYACSIKVLDDEPNHIYDWSTDLMSKHWSAKTVLQRIGKLPSRTMVCDLLMNQEVFTGLGNIMKNETLYRTKLHPETKLSAVSPSKMKKLVLEAKMYATDFYRWKKIFQLKKHWEIMRKKTCPKGHKVTRKVTGVLHRLSHFCETCQPLTI